MPENTTPNTSPDYLGIFGPPARPADWKVIDEGELYEGPEFRDRREEYGVKLLWTPEGFCFGVSSDTDMFTLTKSDLIGLRHSIDQALRAESKLD
ncbi:hypothetical protein [Kocuria kalidii]|uniref:hypothetical protein n=1 Tax=Kocuria kalidii TaxID=3376283 RepID=UPI0037AD59EA